MARCKIQSLELFEGGGAKLYFRSRWGLMRDLGVLFSVISSVGVENVTLQVLYWRGKFYSKMYIFFLVIVRVSSSAFTDTDSLVFGIVNELFEVKRIRCW